MASAERALVVDPLQESAYEFLFGLFVHLVIFLPVHHVFEDVHHDVSNGISEVIWLMPKQDDETTEVRVKDLWNLLTKLTQELFSVFDGLRFRVKTFIDEVDNHQRQSLRAQFLQLRSFCLGKELHQIIDHITFIDQISKSGLEGGMQGLTVIGLQDGLQYDKNADIDLLLFDKITLDDFDADIYVFLEEFRIDLFLLPQNGEI